MRPVRLFGLLILGCATSLAAVAGQSEKPAPAPLSANALDFLVGTWQGTLTYLDVRDNKSRNTIKATLEVSRGGEELRYLLSSVDAKGAPIAGDPTTVSVGPGDTVRFGKEDWRVVSTRRSAGRGSTEMRLSRTATDGNKPARIERIYTRDGSTLRVRTEILPEAQGPRVIRSEYVLTISAAAPVERPVAAVDGLSAERLRDATALLNQFVAEGKIAGAVAAVDHVAVTKNRVPFLCKNSNRRMRAPKCLICPAIACIEQDARRFVTGDARRCKRHVPKNRSQRRCVAAPSRFGRGWGLDFDDVTL